MTQPHQPAGVKGEIFGARQDFCGCNPCDCNPCTCRASRSPNYPSWRVTGYFVKDGTSQEQPLSNQTLLGLALPEQEGSLEDWHEVLLASNDTSLEQIQALLALFESDLDSLPAEVEAPPRTRRAVYRAAIHYQTTEDNPLLRVDFNPTPANLVREGAAQSKIHAWTYDGPMNLRETFEVASI